MDAPARILRSLAMLASLTVAVEASAGVADTWVTTRAKIAVLTAVGTTSTDVNVDTTDGVVTLHGVVGSEKDKLTAEQAVRKLDGIAGIRNRLEVREPGKVVERARDDRIRKNVRAALDAEDDLRGSKIVVRSVNEGTVLLGGTADSVSDHLLAIGTAREVDGVVAVRSEITSPEPGDDSEFRSAVEGGETDGLPQAALDAWLTAATKTRLVADRKTPGLDINVDTNDGVVTLFGTVPDEEAKEAAEAEAGNVSGVKRVENRLVVREPASGTEATSTASPR